MTLTHNQGEPIEEPAPQDTNTILQDPFITQTLRPLVKAAARQRRQAREAAAREEELSLAKVAELRAVAEAYRAGVEAGLSRTITPAPNGQDDTAMAARIHTSAPAECNEHCQAAYEACMDRAKDKSGMAYLDATYQCTIQYTSCVYACSQIKLSSSSGGPRDPAQQLGTMLTGDAELDWTQPTDHGG